MPETEPNPPPAAPHAQVTMFDLEPTLEQTISVDSSRNRHRSGADRLGGDPLSPERSSGSPGWVRVGQTTLAIVMVNLLVRRAPTLTATVFLGIAGCWVVLALANRFFPDALPRLNRGAAVGPKRVRTALRRASGPLTGAAAILAWGIAMASSSSGFVLAPTELLWIVPFGLLFTWMLFRALVQVGAGDLEVEFTPHPAYGGDDLLVRVAIGTTAVAVRRLELRLLCTQPHAKRPNQLAIVLAERRANLTERSQLPDPGGAIEVSFPIPVDAPPSEPEWDAPCAWRLQVRVWSGFGSFRQSFLVPVRSSLFRGDP